MYVNYPMIDVHHHIVPPHMQGKGTMPDWNIKSDKEAMKRLGITGTLLSIPASVPHGQVRRLNKYLAELIAYDPKFYGMLAALPYDNSEAAVEEIAYCLDELKVDGFAMVSNYAGIYIGDDLMNPVLAELDRHSAAVLVHPGKPAGENLPLFDRELSVYEYPFETTRAMMDLIYKGKIRAFPNIRWIVSHAGGTIPYLAYRLSIAKEWGAASQTEEEVLDDIMSLYYDLALSTSPNVFANLKTLVGSSHILFGSDSPMRIENGVARSVREFDTYKGFEMSEKHAIAEGNAKFLFPRFN